MDEPIVYEDYFLVFPNGSIFDTIAGRWVTEHKNSGYREVYLYHPDKGIIRKKVHQIVAQCFIYNSDPQHRFQVNHLDGNKANNHISNLEWCTPYENNLHARVTGLNNISASNKRRWAYEENRHRQSEKLRIVASREDRSGFNNRNHRYTLLFQGKKYTCKEISKILGISESCGFSNLTKLRQGLPNRFTAAGVTLLYE